MQTPSLGFLCLRIAVCLTSHLFRRLPGFTLRVASRLLLKDEHRHLIASPYKGLRRVLRACMSLAKQKIAGFSPSTWEGDGEWLNKGCTLSNRLCPPQGEVGASGHRGGVKEEPGKKERLRSVKWLKGFRPEFDPESHRVKRRTSP